MVNPFDKHKFAKQPKYHEKPEKIKAREQIIGCYRKLTGLNSIPQDCGYWTFCARQENVEGAEIVQLVNSGLILKNQFYGIDYDLKNEGIIEYNRQQHPEANWFKGDWLEIIEENYELFNPAIIYFDYTKTIQTLRCHLKLAKTMNICPEGTFVAANLGLSDGHSSRRFDPNTLITELTPHLRQQWEVLDKFYSSKSSQTNFATFIFTRK